MLRHTHPLCFYLSFFKTILSRIFVPTNFSASSGHPQARIHTGFHLLRKSVRFFHNNHIFSNKRTSQVETWNWWFGQMFSFSNFRALDTPSMKQKAGKGTFRELKSIKLPWSAYPRAPLKAFSFGPSFRKSVSIHPLDPRLIDVCRLDEWDMALCWDPTLPAEVSFWHCSF